MGTTLLQCLGRILLLAPTGALGVGMLSAQACIQDINESFKESLSLKREKGLFCICLDLTVLVMMASCFDLRTIIILINHGDDKTLKKYNP